MVSEIQRASAPYFLGGRNTAGIRGEPGAISDCKNGGDSNLKSVQCRGQVQLNTESPGSFIGFLGEGRSPESLALATIIAGPQISDQDFSDSN